ncbi:GCN5-related N-acetyltransferase [Thalassoporum mexicanum PCC 7367]|uniref:GNAT family N-acetyltransferase n=1 Tax=Thalassoporum mexicanum TaxID=3457544 RepID=UPI00029FBA1A|nr:GNAT family N-acetyltransferase [Pseudanabaena sp. PCC 7367]AFY68942.1 GCN5-related N-acetyltransferase [Pseudanabaena sp. PCC 7367]
MPGQDTQENTQGNTQDFTIRAAIQADAEAIFNLIKALAEYEKLSHAVTGNVESLAAHLFGDRPCAEAIVVELEQAIVGFALFFTNYSTFLTKPGIYLEDLFVLPSHRGKGLGKALLLEVAAIATRRDCGRMEWSVLDWNEPAIAFYEHIGATVLPDWRICRIMGDRLGEIVS